MKTRLRKVIQIAALHGNKALVLGAFGNDARDIARIQRELLVDERLREHFEIIANPILGGRGATLPAFQEILGGYTRHL
jgi:hypothetical protein